MKLIIDIPEEYKEQFVKNKCDDLFNSLATNEFGYVLRKSFETATLEPQPCEDAISREEAKQFLYERIDRLNDDELYDIFSRIIDDMYNELPPVTPSYNSIKTELKSCEDCISREAVLDLAKKGVLISNGNYESVCKAINDLPSVMPKYTDEEIDRAQAVEQAYIDKMVELAVEKLKRPKGEWISKPLVYGVTYCSECDFELKINNTNYCPNCGARMTESEEEE